MHERQGTGGTQSSGSVGSASPDRFHLDVSHPAQKNFRFLILQCGERAAERVLGPALRIGLCWIFEEAVESVEQFRRQLRHAEFAHQIRRFPHDEVVAMRQRLAQGFEASFFRLLAKRVESGDLFLETALAGHGWQFNRGVIA